MVGKPWQHEFGKKRLRGRYGSLVLAAINKGQWHPQVLAQLLAYQKVTAECLCRLSGREFAVPDLDATWLEDVYGAFQIEAEIQRERDENEEDGYDAPPPLDVWRDMGAIN